MMAVLAKTLLFNGNKNIKVQKNYYLVLTPHFHVLDYLCILCLEDMFVFFLIYTVNLKLCTHVYVYTVLNSYKMLSNSHKYLTFGNHLFIAIIT